MKYFFASAILHCLLLFGAIAIQWNSDEGSLRHEGPMQVMILPEQFEIVEKPQILKKVGAVSPKQNKVVKKIKQKISSSAQGKLVRDEKAQDDGGETQALGEGVKTLKLSYKQALNLYFSQNKYYPRKARKLNQTGTVSVKLRVLSNGQFEHVHLEKGCDHKLLNQAAVNLIQKLGKFKPLPKRLGKEMEFIVPIRYQTARGS